MTRTSWHLRSGFFLLCILTLIGIVVHAKIHYIEPVFFTIFQNDVHVDFFSYYKALFLVVVTIIITLLMAYGIARNLKEVNRFKRIEFFILLIMAILATSSSILSNYSQVAFNGSIERYEGLWVWLSYLIIPFLVVYFIRTREQMDRFIKFLMIPTIVIMGIGALQHFGHDIFQMDWTKHILFTQAQQNMIKELRVTATGVYTTLFNQNYVGSFAVLMVPLMTYQLAKALQQKKLHWAFLAFSGLAFSGISLLGAYSSGGYVAVVLAFIMMLVLVVYKNSGWLLKALSILILIAVFGTGSYIYQTNEQLRSQLDFGDVFQNNNEETPFTEQPRQILDIIAEGHEVKIITSRDTFIVKDDDQNLTFLNEGGQEVLFKQVKNKASFVAVDSLYKGYQLNFYLQDNVLEVVVDGRSIQILLDTSGLRIAGIRDLPIIPINAEHIGFEGNEDFGSYRGYIWSRTFPLLKETLLIGHGADTFSFAFPQDDIARFNLTKWRNFRVVIDKPHNTYLQSAVQFGVIFAVLQILLIGWILLRLLFQKWTTSGFFGIAIFTSIFGFSIISLVNDSIVSVSPYFWLVLGLGIVVGHQNQLFPQGEQNE